VSVNELMACFDTTGTDGSCSPFLRRGQEGMEAASPTRDEDPEWGEDGLAGSGVGQRLRRAPFAGLAIAAVVASALAVVGWGALPRRGSPGVARASGRSGLVSEVAVLDPYDCDDELAIAQYVWSLHKKLWCCSNKAKGCPQQAEVTVTFVLANVNYAKVISDAAIKKKVLDTAVDEIVKVAKGPDALVTNANVSVDYWQGSGLFSASTKLDYLGMVIRARIMSTDITKRDLIAKAFSGGTFGTDLQTDLNNCLAENLFDGQVEVKDLTIEQKIVDACTCPNGKEANTSTGCPSFGGEVCNSCTAGYHLTTGKRCELNVCSCPKGQNTTNTPCQIHGNPGCSSCNRGYHIADAAYTACVPNICKCMSGTPATGGNCYMDGGAICASCGTGLHIDHTDLSCKNNTCSCPSGTAAVHEFCTADTGVICESCNIGFHLDPNSRTCKKNACICTNGVPAEDSMCKLDGANICAYCTAGLVLASDRTCGGMNCICPHGVASSGAACDTNGATVCDSCEYGYHKNAGQCVDVGCSCDNGIAAGPADCPVKGSELCITCHYGYTLQAQKCMLNVCTCDNGDPATGAQCRSPGASSCGTCHPGYHPELKNIVDEEGMKLSVLCVPNVCVCIDATLLTRTIGVPATATSVATQVCHTDKGNICQACFTEEGFHLDSGHICRANTCTCTNGAPVDSEHCTTDLAENCTTCNPNFFLANDPLTNWVHGQGIAPPPDPQWDNGAILCIANVLTTTLPFDCNNAQANWETAWSRRKKQWCCHNTPAGVGCVPTHTQKELCTIDHFNLEQCALVGCCKFSGTCQPAAAPGDMVCHVEFNIKFGNNMCLSVPEQAGAQQTRLPSAELKACSPQSPGQDWSPTAQGQIEDTLGNCLDISNDAAGGQIMAKPCGPSGGVPNSQVVSYDPRSMNLRSHLGNCFAVQGTTQIVLKACDPADDNQHWLVPPVSSAATPLQR